MNIKLRPIFLLGIVAIGPLAIAQAPVKLRLNLGSGKTYRYNSSMTTKSSMGAQAQPMTVTMVQVVKVKSKSATGYKVGFSSENVKMQAKAGSPMAGMAKQMEESMKKASYDADIDFRGKTKTTASAMSGMMGGNVGGSLSGFLGVEYPEGPVKVGTTWTTAIDLAKMMGGMASQMKVSGKPILVTYTVKSMGNQGGKQTVTLGIVLKGTANMSMNMGKEGGQMNSTMNMNGKGSAVCDVATGLPIATDMSSTIGINMNGMKIDQQMSVTSKLKG